VCSIYTVSQRVNLFSSLRPPPARSSPKVFNAFSMSHRDFYCRRRRFNCASIHCRGRDIICIVRVLSTRFQRGGGVWVGGECTIRINLFFTWKRFGRREARPRHRISHRPIVYDIII